MTSSTAAILLLILLLIGALPSWRHSRSWGYVPSIGLGVVLGMLLLLMVTGRV